MGSNILQISQGQTLPMGVLSEEFFNNFIVVQSFIAHTNKLVIIPIRNIVFRATPAVKYIPIFNLILPGPYNSRLCKLIMFRY
ncbi:hypothetical protein A3E15_02080 [Candidatus Woesebacteria bacterium RIFCSPHIGHO2_12_FULL_42_9]|uniref:Uncharacterized protein n=1 Tax=Candidatus Woesebacteria bacterium RIFCSPHIGHO2_12_FULL_42_9 TaxID=1802511 RepID=A0A1F8AR87_9BACT|nr:MAG: hypothetical protein A3E15_02080 [Candidatus Woesebacteria bacterium RIFCSPHIGHO2_12_FULL_42_9]